MEKILKCLIYVGIIAALILCFKKYSVETTNNTVDLIIEYNQLKENEQVERLDSFKEYGISSVALNMLSLEELKEKDEVILVEGSELEFLRYFTDIEFKQADFSIQKDKVYLVLRNENIKSQLKDITENSGTGEFKFEKIDFYEDVVILPREEKDLLEKPMFYYKEAVEDIQKHGLSIVPRVPDDTSLEKFKQAAMNLPGFNKIIFSGTEIVGYPEEIEELSSYMYANEVKFGFIEPFIAGQEGSSALASNMNYNNLVRVHSVVEEDMDFLSVDHAVERYQKAVEERNVRALYLKPYTEEEQTGDFIAGLSSSLEDSGYRLGTAESFEFLTGISLYRYKVMLSLAAFICLFVNKFNRRLAILLFVAAIVLLLGTYLMKIYIIYALAALGIALVLPFWIFYWLWQKVQTKESDFKDVFLLYGSATLFAFLAGIAIQGVLFDNSYLVQANMFRGIKVSYLLPILGALLYLFYSKFYSTSQDFTKYILNIVNRPLLVKHVLLFIIIIFVGMLFLMRTGNEPLIAVSEFELLVRDYLENIFQVRPRFKSFFIGYPLLFFGIYLVFKNKVYSWIMVIGLIGPINTINSFTHIHTPFLVSFYRELIGVFLGLILGSILVFIYKRWITYGYKNRVFRLLRLR